MEDNPYQIALKQLEIAANQLKLEPWIHEILKHCMHISMVSLPIKMDNGSVKVFQGYRAQHNTALGPSKGGIRYSLEVSLDEIKALSMWMSWKPKKRKPKSRPIRKSQNPPLRLKMSKRRILKKPNKCQYPELFQAFLYKL